MGGLRGLTVGRQTLSVPRGFQRSDLGRLTKCPVRESGDRAGAATVCPAAGRWSAGRVRGRGRRADHVSHVLDRHLIAPSAAGTPEAPIRPKQYVFLPKASTNRAIR